MLRSSYRLLKRFLPQFAASLRQAYFVLSGDQVRQLVVDFQFRERHAASRLISLSRSFEKLRAPSSESNRIAFVTVLPPDDTGVATFSLLSLFGCSDPVDIICPIRDADWFCTLSELLETTGVGGTRLLDVDTFGFAFQRNKYSTIIMAVGNSPHNFYVFDVLKKINALGLGDRVVFYLHDVCLLSLIFDCVNMRPKEFCDFMCRIYGRPEVSLTYVSDKASAIECLVQSDILGLRFFKRFGVSRFLVNSHAAVDLVSKDFASDSARIDRAFLPVGLPVTMHHMVSPRVPSGHSSSKVRLGSFGVPGNDKKTLDVVRAVDDLRARGMHPVLVIAGFGCRQWAEVHAKELRDSEVEVVDSPSDAEMLQLMASVDVAVQLRRRNLGESSGVVPQLLALGKSVIVSKVGAFVDYGDAVFQVPATASHAEIADSIAELVRAPVSAVKIREYVDAHSSVRLQRLLRDLYALPCQSTPGDARA